jgi:hypothetical protein
MAALACVVERDPSRRDTLRASVETSLGRQGFEAAGRRFDWPGGTLLWRPTPGDPDGALDWQTMPDGFVAVVGTLFAGRCDRASALRSLWDAFVSPQGLTSDEGLFGNYLIAIAKSGRLWLFGDPMGLVKLYRTRDDAVLSTSWLACAESVTGPVVDRIAAQEYVLQGANHGDRTPLEQVGIVPASTALELVEGHAAEITDARTWTSVAATPSSFDDAVAACSDLLARRAEAVLARFPGRVVTALSGGFDSRLLVAAFLSAGEVPDLFVYGGDGDEDVVVARDVAAAIGVPLRHVDKSVDERTAPPLDARRLQDNVDFFDGLPPDGIFDRGPDRATRLAQSRDGRVAVNGGGGEILRNFFYLADEPYDAAQVVDAFYSGFLPEALPRPDDEAAYRAAMIDAIHREVGTTGRLARRQVELVYPLVRGRYWMARNNSIAVRTGHFLTMLLDPLLVPLAASLPLAWKDYGRLESAMIARLSPALGARSTAYGFAPQDGPPPAYRAKMWLQHRRPTWLRRRSATIKHRLGRLQPIDMTDDQRALLPGPLEVGRLVALDRLSARDQVDRALTLEVLIRRLGARVA